MVGTRDWGEGSGNISQEIDRNIRHWRWIRSLAVVDVVMFIQDVMSAIRMRELNEWCICRSNVGDGRIVPDNLKIGDIN